MKKTLFYTLLLLSSAGILSGCLKGNNYPGGTVSSIIAITDVRTIYKGSDITLTTSNMFGAHQITGMVVSDFSGGNMPAGLLVVQNNRRTRLRGISIPLGTGAANYSPGDSVLINIEGGVLKRVNGTLQLTGITPGAITKISTGNTVLGQKATTAALVANPDSYESTLVAVVKGSLDPLPAPTDQLSGDKVINDGFGNITLHTEATAAFAGTTALPLNANFTGIILGTTNATGAIIPQLRLRTVTDIKALTSVIAPVLITGFITDPTGTDANYEYVQLLATRDINFAAEPFSLVTTNNAGASTPVGFPVNGWATGDLRTYKLEITSGSVTKGSYFYVGGTGKKINGSASTDISSSNWVKAFNYSTANSPNFSTVAPITFGTKTSNLLANSGNAGGIAVFSGTNITATTKPVDVIFYGNGGSLYDPATQAGYPITNTDFYDQQDLVTLADQRFFKMGTNTLFFPYPNVSVTTPTAYSYFAELGGVYNPNLGKWVTARALINVMLTNTSVLTDIEGAAATKLK